LTVLKKRRINLRLVCEVPFAEAKDLIMASKTSKRFRLFLLLLPCLAAPFAPLLAQPPLPTPIAADPDSPKGVDVQTRGAIHEAFANPTAETLTPPMVARRPPTPIEEMPPADKPEGNSTWIGGYWNYDDDRNDFVWVSGCWRTVPPGRQWVPGYWRDQGDKWQWAPGFWAAADKQGPAGGGVQIASNAPTLNYVPEPPIAPKVAPPGPAPNDESFFMPGQYVYRDDHYVWVAGYWARVQPGYAWVPGHYRWTPHGYVYIPGYWDYALARRGLMYAPVVINPVVVGPGFVYTPVYAVPQDVVVDAFWVRPAYGCYYYGDYYGPVYRPWGFQCGLIYGRDHYDCIVVYRGWECRGDPRWHETQINIYLGRDGGRMMCPPRTLFEQNRFMREHGGVAVGFHAVMPGARVAEAAGMRTVRLDERARMQAKTEARAAERASIEHRAQAAAVHNKMEAEHRAAAAHAATAPKAGPASPAAKGPAPAAKGPAPLAKTAPAHGQPPAHGAPPAPPPPHTAPPAGNTEPGRGTGPGGQEPPAIRPGGGQSEE
jgi:hypothetical protein